MIRSTLFFLLLVAGTLHTAPLPTPLVTEGSVAVLQLDPEAFTEKSRARALQKIIDASLMKRFGASPGSIDPWLESTLPFVEETLPESAAAEGIEAISLLLNIPDGPYITVQLGPDSDSDAVKEKLYNFFPLLMLAEALTATDHKVDLGSIFQVTSLEEGANRWLVGHIGDLPKNSVNSPIHQGLKELQDHAIVVLVRPNSWMQEMLDAHVSDPPFPSLKERIQWTALWIDVDPEPQMGVVLQCNSVEDAIAFKEYHDRAMPVMVRKMARDLESETKELTDELGVEEPQPTPTQIAEVLIPALSMELNGSLGEIVLSPDEFRVLATMIYSNMRNLEAEMEKLPKVE